MAFENPEELEISLVGQTLTSIKFYNVNDSYFVFDQKNLAVIDGGIELVFGERILAIAWNTEKELFDVNTSSVKPLLGALDFYQIDSAEFPFQQDILGSRVTALKAKWNWYNNLDDELEPVGEKQYILIEVVFSFENGHHFQVATISYEIENKSIHKARFDSQGELLLSLDRVIEIEGIG